MAFVPPEFTWGEVVMTIFSAIVGYFARLFTSRK